MKNSKGNTPQLPVPGVYLSWSVPPETAAAPVPVAVPRRRERYLSAPSGASCTHIATLFSTIMRFTSPTVAAYPAGRPAKGHWVAIKPG